MENASKALIMAGSILLALLVIGALIFMFREVGSNRQSDQEEVKQAQINEFNKSYLSYEKTLYGSELLSLVNKMEDYNKKENQENNGYTPMEITITIKQATGSLFKAGSYNINSILTLIEKVRVIQAKTKYKGDKTLQELASVETATNGAGTEERKKFNELCTKLGLDPNDTSVLTDIRNYGEYVEFKRKKFECKRN